MSLRSSFPRASLPTSHYFITFARGERMRTLSVRPSVLFGGVGVLALIGVWYLVATVYLVFRDDMLAALVSGETQMQYAYEDRLAEMRTQVDKVTSRQLLDQTSFEGKVHALASRQAQLESRAQLVATLSDEVRLANAGAAKTLRSARGAPDSAAAAISGVAADGDTSALPGLSSFAPLPNQIMPGQSTAARPRPDERSDASEPGASMGFVVADRRMPVPLRLGIIAESLDHIEAAQLDSLGAIDRAAHTTAARLETAFNEAGLAPERFARAGRSTAAMGGPFVPLQPGVRETPFEARIRDLQKAVWTAGRLKKLLPVVPLRRPLTTAAEITSGFGVRIDPFNGRGSMHTGLDFGQPYGTSVRATAAGRVSIAGPEGGYGNLVEINHGNGLSTRYGHLSAILVAPGQWVEVGGIIGEVGSTGRSTGPHLHYETRIDGEAVDPLRFLRAGQRLFAGDL